MKGNLWGVLIVFVFIGLMLPAVSLGFEDATEERTIDDESLTLEYDEAVEVAHASHVTEDSDVVVTDADGNELVEGDDYDWDADDGTITALEEDLDGDDVSVEYHAEVQTDDTIAVAQILSVFDGWIAIMALLAVLGMVWAVTSFGFGGGY